MLTTFLMGLRQQVAITQEAYQSEDPEVYDQARIAMVEFVMDHTSYLLGMDFLREIKPVEEIVAAQLEEVNRRGRSKSNQAD